MATVPESPSHVEDAAGARDDQPGPRTARRIRQPPLMRIVTKGWWSTPDEYATAEELEKAGRT